MQRKTPVWGTFLTEGASMIYICLFLEIVESQSDACYTDGLNIVID